jgi:hypothetical protein
MTISPAGANLFALLALAAWIPLLMFLYLKLPPRRAALAGALIAWLFLPVAEIKVPDVPVYSKTSCISAGILVGAAVFDAARFLRLRVHPVDLPMILWCLCPLASSLDNGLGIHDGVSAVAYQTLTWGIPYAIGRLYFSDREGIRDLAWGFVIGGLAYVPLCLYEIRMSPQLHRMLYGFHQHEFAQTIRFGGFRPVVFMHHGLMVGLWMSAATLVGAWLWWAGAVRPPGRRLWGALFIVLAATTMACKSFGALLLLAVGLGCLGLSRALGTKAFLWGLACLAPVYVAARVTQTWSGEGVLPALSEFTSERAASFKFRLTNETMLIEKAMQRPLLGWSGWGRSRVYDESGRDVSVTDGLWIIELGTHGIVGLVSMVLAFLLPVAVFLNRVPLADWFRPPLAPAAALAAIVLVALIDYLPNGLINPLYTVAVGGLAGLAIAWRDAAPASPGRWHGVPAESAEVFPECRDGLPPGAPHGGVGRDASEGRRHG